MFVPAGMKCRVYSGSGYRPYVFNHGSLNGSAAAHVVGDSLVEMATAFNWGYASWNTGMTKDEKALGCSWAWAFHYSGLYLPKVDVHVAGREREARSLDIMHAWICDETFGRFLDLLGEKLSKKRSLEAKVE